MGVVSRLEKSYYEPPCQEPEWGECAHCGGEILLEDAERDLNDFPYCSGECLDAGPYES